MESRTSAVALAEGPRRIAVVPAFNEETTVAKVLEGLAPLVDSLLVVDDGSTDRTRAEIQEWLPGHDHAELLTHESNQGMSEAYYLAFTELKRRLREGELHPDDLVATVDADGQHELASLDNLFDVMLDEALDAVLVHRDLGDYPTYKQLGNKVMSVWATRWSGMKMNDVESGYRVFRLGALAHALDYYQGYKYSETVEVAVVLPRLGYRVRNDLLVPVPVFRSRTSFYDAAIDLGAMPLAWWRVESRRSPVVRVGLPVAAAGAALAGARGLRRLVRSR